MMMFRIKKLSCVLGLAGLVSCGGTPKLTDEQKREFFATLASAGQGVGAAVKADQARQSTENPVPFVGAIFNKMAIAMAERSSEEKIDYMTSELRPDLCEMKSEGMDPNPNMGSGSFDPTNPFSGGDVKMSLKIEGKDCPIDLNFLMDAHSKSAFGSASMIFKMNIDYAVKADPYRNLNDVDGVKLAMNFSASVDNTAKTLNGKLDVSGNIHSQAVGDLPIEGEGKMKADEDSADMNFKVKMTFPKFAAVLELKQHADKNNPETEPKLYLNGDEINQEELKRLFSENGSAPSLSKR